MLTDFILWWLLCVHMLHPPSLSLSYAWNLESVFIGLHNFLAKQYYSSQQQNDANRLFMRFVFVFLGDWFLCNLEFVIGATCRMHIGSPTVFGIENDADDEDDDIDNINECDDDQFVLYKQ